MPRSSFYFNHKLQSLVLSLVHVAVWSRYMRTAMLDSINQDFVKTARAKGVPEGRILMKHVVGNALLPMITLAGMQLPSILTGALVTDAGGTSLDETKAGGVAGRGRGGTKRGRRG